MSVNAHNILIQIFCLIDNRLFQSFLIKIYNKKGNIMLVFFLFYYEENSIYLQAISIFDMYGPSSSYPIFR